MLVVCVSILCMNIAWCVVSMSSIIYPYVCACSGVISCTIDCDSDDGDGSSDSACSSCCSVCLMVCTSVCVLCADGVLCVGWLVGLENYTLTPNIGGMGNSLVLYEESTELRLK